MLPPMSIADGCSPRTTLIFVIMATILKIKSLDNCVVIHVGTSIESSDAFGISRVTKEYGRIIRANTNLSEGDDIDMDSIPHTLETKEYSNKETGEVFNVNWITLK